MNTKQTVKISGSGKIHGTLESRGVIKIVRAIGT
jgi:hypothetical protein